MLSSFEKGIITLINNALKGEKNPLPKDFDYSGLHDFSVKQKDTSPTPLWNLTMLCRRIYPKC